MGNCDSPLVLPAIKIFASVHNCKELFEHFLTKFESEDKKLAVFTSYVFKDLSFDHEEFVEQKYLPALLNIAEKD